jgi:hypothetical protein
MRAYGVPGFSGNKDLDIVYEWAKTVSENGTIVEIGSMFGRTAVAFAEGAHPSVKIYCIDYFNDITHTSADGNVPGEDFWILDKTYNRGVEFDKFTKDYPNITKCIVPKGQRVYQYTGELIDVLFLDGAHTNPTDIQNIVYYKKFLNKNALICGHDYSIRFPDIIKNVKILQKMYNTTVTLYQNSSMWSLRIKT